MPLPQRRSLPSLQDIENISIEENDDNLIDLTDEDLGNSDNNLYDSEYNENYLNDKELEAFSEENNHYEEEYLFDEESQEELIQEEPQVKENQEEITNEVSKRTKIKKNNKKEKLNLPNVSLPKVKLPDNLPIKKIGIIAGAVLVVIILLSLLFSLLGGGKKDSVTPLSEPQQSSKINIEVSNEGNTSVYLKVTSDEETPGIVQAIYSSPTGKTVLCESTENDFSSKTKEVEAACYNIGSDIINDLKLIETKLVKSNYN